MRCLAGGGPSLWGQHGLEPFFDQLLTNSGDSPEASVQRRSESGCRSILPQPHLHRPSIRYGPESSTFSRRVLATLDQGYSDALALPHWKLHDIPLYSNLCRDHESAPSLRYGSHRISNILPNVNDVAGTRRSQATHKCIEYFRVRSER